MQMDANHTDQLQKCFCKDGFYNTDTMPITQVFLAYLSMSYDVMYADARHTPCRAS